MKARSGVGLALALGLGWGIAAQAATVRIEASNGVFRAIDQTIRSLGYEDPAPASFILEYDTLAPLDVEVDDLALYNMALVRLTVTVEGRTVVDRTEDTGFGNIAVENGAFGDRLFASGGATVDWAPGSSRPQQIEILYFPGVGALDSLALPTSLPPGNIDLFFTPRGISSTRAEIQAGASFSAADVSVTLLPDATVPVPARLPLMLSALVLGGLAARTRSLRLSATGRRGRS